MTFSTVIFHRTGLCHGCLGDHGLAGGFHSKSPSHRSGLGDQWWPVVTIPVWWPSHLFHHFPPFPAPGSRPFGLFAICQDAFCGCFSVNESAKRCFSQEHGSPKLFAIIAWNQPNRRRSKVFCRACGCNKLTIMCIYVYSVHVSMIKKTREVFSEILCDYVRLSIFRVRNGVLGVWIWERFLHSGYHRSESFHGLHGLLQTKVFNLHAVVCASWPVRLGPEPRLTVKRNQTDHSWPGRSVKPVQNVDDLGLWIRPLWLLAFSSRRSQVKLWKSAESIRILHWDGWCIQSRTRLPWFLDFAHWPS